MSERRERDDTQIVNSNQSALEASYHMQIPEFNPGEGNDVHDTIMNCFSFFLTDKKVIK